MKVYYELVLEKSQLVNISTIHIMTKYEVIQGVYYLYDKWRGGLYTPGLTYIGMNPPA